MSAKSADEFEGELRALCDSFFYRDGLPQFPFGDLSEGKLSREQLRQFYVEQNWWEASLVFSGTVLALLLEGCPDTLGRVKLWELIQGEYGCGKLHASHALLAKKFLLGLGIAAADLPMSLPLTVKNQQIVTELEKKSFVELLAGNFLGPETVGPKVFNTYAKLLREQFGMTRDDVSFFLVHGEQDKNDSDVLFELTARYARSEEDQDAVKRAITDHYERPRIRALCVLRPIAFTYQNQ